MGPVIAEQLNNIVSQWFKGTAVFIQSTLHPLNAAPLWESITHDGPNVNPSKTDVRISNDSYADEDD